jgi:hypothetical protein
MDFKNDILLNEDDDIAIVAGDIVIGESVLQEVGIILGLNTGELKSDPILGPNLVQLINGKYNSAEFEERVLLHLKHDNKRYDEIKSLITLNKIQ